MYTVQSQAFLCPECGSHEARELECQDVDGNPWGAVPQRYLCAGCGCVIPAHLGELWNGIGSEAAAQEWRQHYRATAPLVLDD